MFSQRAQWDNRSMFDQSLQQIFRIKHLARGASFTVRKTVTRGALERRKCRAWVPRFSRRGCELYVNRPMDRCQVHARFFGVQVQGSRGGTDTSKVTECANTVIMGAQVQQIFLSLSLSAANSTGIWRINARCQSIPEEFDRTRCCIIGLITLGHSGGPEMPREYIWDVCSLSSPLVPSANTWIARAKRILSNRSIGIRANYSMEITELVIAWVTTRPIFRVTRTGKKYLLEEKSRSIIKTVHKRLIASGKKIFIILEMNLYYCAYA